MNRVNRCLIFVALLLLVIPISNSYLFNKILAPPPLSIGLLNSVYCRENQNCSFDYIFVNNLISVNTNITNNAYVKENFTVGGTFLLETPVEDDLFFPADIIQVKGSSNIPSTGLYTLDFDDDTMEQVFVTYQLPHTRAYGTNMEPHFHWQSELNNTGNVVWCMEYSGANISGMFTPWETKCTVSASLGDSRYHVMSPEIVIPNATFTASAMGKLRLFRNATDTRDTLVGDAKLLQFDVHIYKDKLGGHP